MIFGFFLKMGDKSGKSLAQDFAWKLVINMTSSTSFVLLKWKLVYCFKNQFGQIQELIYFWDT